MLKVDNIYNDVTNDLSELAFLSLRNFVLFHEEELLNVHNGENLYDYFYPEKSSKLSNKGIMLTFKDNGIKKKRLTCLARMILKGMI